MSAKRSDLRPTLDPTNLAVSRWPLDWTPGTLPDGFVALVRDEQEVTLVCAEGATASYREPLGVEVGWHRVTFEGPLPWELVGFLADVASRPAARSGTTNP